MGRKSEPSKRSSRDDALLPDQWERFIRAAESPVERLRCRLAGVWGLRADEIAHANRDWISATQGTLTIPARCRCRHCRESGTSWTPKTPAGNRTLPINKDAATWMAVKEYFGAGERRPVTSRAVHKTIKRVADRAGIFEPVYPHALRATAVTRLASKGLNGPALARIFGWADERPAREYIQASGIDATKALEDIDFGL